MQTRTALSTIVDITDRVGRLLGKVGIQVGGSDVGGGNPIPVSLPATAATAALQTTGNGSLASVDGKLPAALGPTTPDLSLSTVQARSLAVCTWQITAGVAVLPLVPVWSATHLELVGEPVTNGGHVYRCITGGITAGSGGPTGTGADIVDGAAHWAWVGPVATAFAGGFAMVNIDNTKRVYYGTAPNITTTTASSALPPDGGQIRLNVSPAIFYVVSTSSSVLAVTAVV